MEWYGGVEHTLIAPLCQVFLPLRNDVVWVCGVAIGLRIGIGGSSLMCGSVLNDFIPPIVDALVAFGEVIATADHRVKEVFSSEAMRIDEIYGSLTLCYLCMGVATEAYARAEPTNSSKTDGKFLCDESCIQCLVEVYPIATADDGV